MCFRHLLIVSVLLAGAWPAGAEPAASAPLNPVERSDEDLLVFEVRLGKHLLSEGLFGFRQSDPAGAAGRPGVLLPLGEVVALLELPVRIDPLAGTAAGWLTEKSEGFHLDLASGRASVAGEASTVGRGQAEIHADDLYVEAAVLSRWLPVDFEIDLANLVLRLEPRRRLPLERRLEREARWRSFGGHGAAGRDGPRFPARVTPYRLLDWPVLDGSFDVAFERRTDGTAATTARHSLLAQGDLLAMTADLFLSGRRGSEVNDPLADVRLTLGRRDPEAGLLGPLRATELRLGDLTSPSDPLISRGRPGRGFELARATGPDSGGGPREFDRKTLRGDALPGWDVELYRNDVLYDFAAVGADGRYEFADVPLLYGENLLRLVFYGPYGETRDKIERVFIGAGLLRPGETEYRFGVYQQDVGLFQRGEGLAAEDAAVQGELRLAADFARGLTRSLSVEAGLCRLPLADGHHDYARLGLRTSLFGTAGRLVLLRDSAGGTAGRLNLQRRLGRFTLAAEHTSFGGLISEEVQTADLLSRTEARLDGQLRLPRAGVLPLGLTLRHERRQEGTLLELRGTTGFTLPVGRMSLTNRWHLDLTGNDGDAGALGLRGNILLNGLIRGLAVRGNLSYELQPEAALSSVDLTGRWRPSPRLGTTFGFNHGLAQGVTHLSAGADWQMRALRAGLTLGWGSDGSLRTGASLSFSLGREPRSGRPRLHAEPAARQGAVSARAFLDHNLNGRFDAGDEALEGVRFAVNGGRHATAAGADGVAQLALAPFNHADLTVDEASLEDPFWVPQVDGLGFVPRPGAVWTAEFPVVLTGEVDGTVTLLRDQGVFPASKVRLQLVGPDGGVVQEVESQFDGFYLFGQVPPGRYALHVDPEQAARLRLRPIPSRAIVLGSGEVLSVDVELERMSVMDDG